jgi:epoxyqueuosine reductase
MNNSESLKSCIREEAQRLGFFKMGIASARPLPRIEHFNAWLERGFHGAMSYMERQAPKRENPGLVLANVRTILVAAMNYYGMEFSAIHPLKGRISRYARGDDYHGILMGRLRELLNFIKSRIPSVQGLCYVDTGPVMEKTWGAETALGWLGKHTNIITRSRGSWLFLGVILLDSEIESDSREKDYCGNCSRCISACPTGAIVAPYVIDARFCISYLTIELRGPIPRSLRSSIGNRIFGCDDCQDACPWNRFATKTSEIGFRPRQESLAPELRDLIRINSRDFKKNFDNSPILRATRNGFVRNVAVALGNSQSNEAVPALKTALCDESPLVRSHAAWGLGQIATEQAIDALLKAKSRESDPDALAEIGLAVEKNS